MRGKRESGHNRWLIRFAHGRSVGSGSHPDCQHVAGDLKYLAHGAPLEASRMIAQTGTSRRGRLRIHPYGRGRNGKLLRAWSVRAASEVAIAANAQQLRGDGVIFYISPINVYPPMVLRCNRATIFQIRPTPRSGPKQKSYCRIWICTWPRKTSKLSEMQPEFGITALSDLCF